MNENVLLFKYANVWSKLAEITEIVPYKINNNEIDWTVWGNNNYEKKTFKHF